MLSKRLLRIASYIKGYNSFVDVGTDHGYLGIYAAKDLGIKKVLLTDVNDKPLSVALDNIAIYHLENEIQTRLGDGLAPIDDNYECLNISGMGGILISKILLADINKAKKFKRLILSPNRDSLYVRKTLMNNGFEIEYEEMVLDYKYYEIIVAKPTDEEVKYSLLELKYGPILMKEKSETFKDFYGKRLEFFKKELANSTSKRSYDELKNKCSELEMIL